MNISRNKYLLTSTHALPELKKRFKNNTLVKNRLVREKTDKAFIGKLTDDGFVLITSKGLGVVCELKGSYTPVQAKGKAKGTEIALATRIQPVFFTMMAIWFVLMGVMSIALPMIKDPAHVFPVIPVIVIVTGILAFRVLLHGLYLMARDKGKAHLEALMAS